MGAEDLVEVLAGIAPFDHPWVDPDVGPLDDAALLRPDSGGAFAAGGALAFTVDFITPIVDDPETFGAIAAANSLSDVYAMGGDPQVALAICGFPEGEVPHEVLSSIFKGGRDKAAEAGCAVVGGHTVIDPELKYGLCVLGSVPGDASLSQTRARPGDRLVLSKPIGTGIAAQAIKKGLLSDEELRHTAALMATLNRGAKNAALAAGARAATDVTGFGLLGHLHNLLQACGASARLEARHVPVLEWSRRLAAEGVTPGGTHRNLDYVRAHTRFADGLAESERLLLCDAQTSGGLLIAVPAERADELVAALEREATPAAAVIGEIREGAAGSIDVGD